MKKTMTLMILAAIFATITFAQPRVHSQAVQQRAQKWAQNTSARKPSADIRQKALEAAQGMQSFGLPTDRDVVLVTGYSGLVRAAYGRNYPTRVDAMTFVTDLPGNDFEKISALAGGDIFTISSNGLFHITDPGRQGIAGTIYQYPTVGMVDTLAALGSNVVVAGRANNPYVLQYTLGANGQENGLGVNAAGFGSVSTAVLNNGDIYILDAAEQYVYRVPASGQQTELYYYVPTGNAVAIATNAQGNQIYLALAGMPGQDNQTCSSSGPCPPSVAQPALPGQIILLEQALGPNGPFVNPVVVLSGNQLNNVQFGPHSFFVSGNLAYIDIYQQGGQYQASGDELWAFDMSQQDVAYTFLSAEFAPDATAFALYPAPPKQ
jgi:hypothetical protein